MLLVSPVVNWARSIRYGMSRSHIPALMANSAIAALSSPLGSRLLGLGKPLALADQLPSPLVPTLIVHSRGDQTAPFAASWALATTSDFVELEEFPSCPHAMEWNSDPQRFSEVAEQWIAGRERATEP
jgi:pimeloyl-ACP methyl ester carboxylesterase